jgi:hypothetical protein
MGDRRQRSERRAAARTIILVSGRMIDYDFHMNHLPEGSSGFHGFLVLAIKQRLL